VQFEPRILESFDPVTQELYRDEFLQQSIHLNQGKWMNQCITTNTAEENRAAPGEALGDCAAGAQPKKEKSLVKNQTLDSCWRQRSLCWGDCLQQE
jgi:hypothetical protein